MFDWIKRTFGGEGTILFEFVTVNNKEGTAEFPFIGKPWSEEQLIRKSVPHIELKLDYDIQKIRIKRVAGQVAGEISGNWFTVREPRVEIPKEWTKGFTLLEALGRDEGE